ncbi:MULTISPECIES: Bug family tripartite tricarboxylate transporter substrate binding protein [unclassified Variovorax]|uniref:Bug family tripartite tricarboxylate transporter substrate binding protein n=1 Tax=unclassified Variovorax TaxID=663243 RepID=UPI000898B5D4|nr:Tripartite-type tricarboxylate transporter, receptor component TctC [Variovorax sp. NFACC28]SEF70197.1 Tripartite-type tricarboxylate transporter, receptor component TctC [Variovorax sp. NFACC29]SFB76328.1 Tripartite-type tricarboxylate transporter, receptor component TctC [Variovorax sp. NFACC26]SFG76032.1 Tripartite-type tricarboxylate transporter, receptor component TctC [Variovorax sp. NFACC27]
MIIQRILLMATFTLALVPAAVRAEPKTTRIVVSFTSGGPVDSVARVLSEQLGKELGRTVIVDNKPGANGAIGAVDVMKSAPDGGTLWFTSVGAAAVNPSLYEKLPYDMQRDFAPVSLVVNNVELLVTQQSNPARDAADFVAATKKRAEPVPMGSSGTGSIPHLAIEQLADSSGARLLHVPYKGAAPAITDLMGGQIGGFFGDVPGLLGHLQGGRLKALGVASNKRHPALPDVKTLEEQGIRGVDTNNWYALFAPAKTPPEVIDALSKAVRNTLANPGVREKLLKTGTEPVGSTPQELAAIQKRDSEKWAKLIRAKNIKAE